MNAAARSTDENAVRGGGVRYEKAHRERVHARYLTADHRSMPTPAVLAAVAVKIFIALSLLLCAGAYPAVIVRSDPPEKLELANNWTLSRVGGLPADGATVSRGDYNDSEWYKVRRMPATVLEILQEDDL